MSIPFFFFLFSIPALKQRNASDVAAKTLAGAPPLLSSRAAASWCRQAHFLQRWNLSKCQVVSPGTSTQNLSASSVSNGHSEDFKLDTNKKCFTDQDL